MKLQKVDIIDSYLMVHPFIFTGGNKLFNLPFVFSQTSKDCKILLRFKEKMKVKQRSNRVFMTLEKISVILQLHLVQMSNFYSPGRNI